MKINCPGDHCGWPPVPVNAEVVTQFIPGTTTEVTYKCNDHFVLDPSGPQNSTCDQVTGSWTKLPRCICPDPPHVPGGGRMIRRDAFTARFQCGNGYQLIGEDTITCDDQGLWSELPSCNYWTIQKMT